MDEPGAIVLVAHCLLNANSRVEGLAAYPGTHPLIGELVDRGVALVQLPCPELPVGGCKRWAATIEQYDTPFYREHCDRLAEDIAQQVREYLRCGVLVAGLVGVEGSPSCGVIETTSGDWGGWHDEEEMARMRASKERVPGSGVFMKALAVRLKPLGVSFTAVDERDSDGGVSRALGVL